MGSSPGTNGEDDQCQIQCPSTDMNFSDLNDSMKADLTNQIIYNDKIKTLIKTKVKDKLKQVNYITCDASGCTLPKNTLKMGNFSIDSTGDNIQFKKSDQIKLQVNDDSIYMGGSTVDYKTTNNDFKNIKKIGNIQVSQIVNYLEKN